MSVSVSLPDRNNISKFFHYALYAPNGYSNMTDMTVSATMPSDGNLPSSIIPILGQSDGNFDSSNNQMAGLRGYGTLHPGEYASSTTRSSPGNSFKVSPTTSISNYSISPNELEDAKNINVAPQAPGNDAAVDGSTAAMNNTEDDTTASKPRTRSSTGSTSKQRQTQQQTQVQTETQTPKQKQQPAASKSKKSPAKSKNGNGNGGRKSQPRNRSLERNRTAASKCRQKKKEWLTDLEANKSKLEKQYKSIHGEYNELLDEVTQLKNFLMTHAGCNDPNIDEWINNEANTYIRRLSQNVGPQGAAAAGGPAQANQTTRKDTKSLSSPDSQVSNPLTSPKNNGGFSNDYMSDGMFDTDPLMGQSVSTNWSIHGNTTF